MWLAAMWGSISGSAVLLGAIISLYFSIPKKIIGDIMAFGTGVLIGAASYELLGEAVNDGGLTPTTIGFVSGAVIFTIFDYAISKKGGSDRKRSGQKAVGGGGLAIFIGTIMDAVPESIIIGASLLEQQTVSFLLVIAIFISNIPEGLSSTYGMKNSGYSRRKILLLWFAVVAISTLGAWGGYILLNGASEHLMSGIAAFAGGGIIAMVASSMMPEAYEDSGPITGLMAALGLLVSLMLDRIS
ncbi:ZIP family metal transporter [Bacillus sp. V5-8f]|uniref:ZIP family metal transporter n=1 Tax=Bacillus sp. V5-8f TaxID=2053044 RepID=UPI000C77A672|nr:ZIP family metal transporter [Bacillus sp. V5-8f]PLT32249.1 hypothetical protein CUU64_19265 [Bacillus sp. V5-8f]